MPIALKRVYEAPEPEDGYRVLVDRLWPRGKSKEKARIDQWIRNASPSDELRKAYHSGDINWETFREKYLQELEECRDLLVPLAEMAMEQQVTLVYSSKEKEFNNAAVLREYLEKIVS
jgi:uncharacterized protein YeaO (DUF488 family)